MTHPTIREGRLGMKRRHGLCAVVAVPLTGLGACWTLTTVATAAPHPQATPSKRAASQATPPELARPEPTSSELTSSELAQLTAAAPQATTPNVPHSEHSKQLPYRQGWTAHELVGSEWNRLYTGLGRRTITPGSILGLRFSARQAGDQRPPRHAPTLDDICGNTPDVAPERAAGIVIDYGRRVDAMSGEAIQQPARLQHVCLPNTQRETYAKVLSAAGVVLDGDKVCRVNSYPSAGCGLSPSGLSPEALAADLPITAKALPTATSTAARSALEVRSQPLATSGDEGESTDNRWLPVALVAAFLAAAALVAQRLIQV